MNSPIKLLSTDFDGTLFAEFENPPIPMELQELIGRLQAGGAKWAINTGRDMSSLMEALGASGHRGRAGLPRAGRAGNPLPPRVTVYRPRGVEQRLRPRSCRSVRAGAGRPAENC